jgi:hypothetical protein
MSTIDARAVKARLTRCMVALLIGLVWATLALRSLYRSHKDELNQESVLQPTSSVVDVDYRAYSPPALKPATPAIVQKAGVMGAQVTTPKVVPDAVAGRRIVRTASMDIVAQHPGETADQITAIAEKMGGYLVSADGGGQSAATAHVTIHVPVAQFDEVRTEIRQLGVRVEGEKFEAQDVTRQFVDQAASIRNLQAQEMQYLAILNRANDVGSMVMLSGKLSEVRGQIEKLQAEANSSLEQAENVSLTVSLRNEAQPQISGLDWRPLYELRIAANDGLSNVIAYAAAMVTVLLYLPAALLWAGTLLLAAVLGWKGVHWLRLRWPRWTASQTPIQG